MTTIVRAGSVKLTVYHHEKRGKHKLPHFHVIDGGEEIASVSLLDLKPIVGRPLSRRIRKLCEANWEELWEAWDEHNAD